MFRLYPEFARAAGVQLVECEPVPIPIGQIIEGARIEHEPFSTPT